MVYEDGTIRPLELSATLERIYDKLLDDPYRVVPWVELRDHVRAASLKSLSVQVWQLRRKLEAAGIECSMRVVYGALLPTARPAVPVVPRLLSHATPAGADLSYRPFRRAGLEPATVAPAGFEPAISRLWASRDDRTSPRRGPERTARGGRPLRVEAEPPGAQPSGGRPGAQPVPLEQRRVHAGGAPDDVGRWYE